MLTLPEHIEKYLGQITCGWNFRRGPAEFQVVKVINCPERAVVTYSTLGLNATALDLPQGNAVRQELVFAAYERYESDRIASFLLTFGESLRSQGRALLRGDVVGPGKPLISGISLNSVYCSMPVMFDARLETYNQSQPPTVFVWLVSISEEEASYVRAYGWNRFEDLLEQRDVDFWNLDRPSLALPVHRP